MLQEQGWQRIITDYTNNVGIFWIYAGEATRKLVQITYCGFDKMLGMLVFDLWSLNKLK